MSNIDRARHLRRNMSAPETLLWQHLRARPGGFKFRRQRPLGPYFLDSIAVGRSVHREAGGRVADRVMRHQSPARPE